MGARRALPGLFERRRHRARRLLPPIAEIGQRRDGIGDRRRRGPAPDIALQAERLLGAGPGKSRRAVLQLGNDTLGDLRPDARRPRHHRLVLKRDRIGEIAGRQRADHRQRHLRSDALHALEQLEPFALRRTGKAVKPDHVLAHDRLDEEDDRFPRTAERREGTRPAIGHIADTVNVDEHIVFADLVDRAFQFADHAEPSGVTIARSGK